MIMEQLLNEVVEALGPHYVVMTGAPGVERPAILVPAELIEAPRGRRRQVRPVYGPIVRAWYLQYRDQMRWAFVEENAGSCRWLLFHLWSEGECRWVDCLKFRTLRQPRRGHRLVALHGRRVSVSYSQGLDCQLVLVTEEADGFVWWVLYLELPEQQLLHMISIQVEVP